MINKKQRHKPDFLYEKKYWRNRYLVIGVDEVGRGAWAGPIVAGAVSIKLENVSINWENISINDSKKLPPKKRQELSKIIRRNALWGIGEVGVSHINRYGIISATAKAMRQAIANAKFKMQNSKLHKNPRIFVLVDAFHIKYIPGVGLGNQLAIIHGDQKSISVAAASIIAKVYRDNLMTRLNRESKYKKYGWAQSKGYGTTDHQERIKKYGLTRFHRKEFIPKSLPG